MRGFCTFLAVLLCTSSCFAKNKTPDEDALSLLNRTIKKYVDAQTLHLEATRVNLNFNAYRTSEARSVLSYSFAPGNRYRYEGHDGSGSGLLIADGRKEWVEMRSLGQYVEEDPGVYRGSRISLESDFYSITNAMYLKSEIVYLNNSVRSAKYLAPEKLEVEGKKVRCVVIRITDKDLAPSNLNPSPKLERTIWIDPETLHVVQTKRSSTYVLWFGASPAPRGEESHATETVNFTRTEMDQPIPDAIFSYVPPRDFKKVPKIPQPNYGQPMGQPASGSVSAKESPVEAMLGKPLPSASVVSQAGVSVPLNSLGKGRPVLIDVWATWCGPCLTGMDAMKHIRSSTSQTDLVVIGVDQDEASEDAAAFLKRRGYDWDDYHSTKDFSHSMKLQALPTTVLVNAEGKIVYYHIGADDMKGLAAAIAKLGKAYAGATSE